MKNTKRIVALLLVLMLSLTMFVGCSKDEDKADKDDKKETVAQEVEEKEDIDPEEAIVGTWSKECDLSDMLDEYMASAEPEFAEFFDFSDFNYIIEITFDDGELSIDGEFDEDVLGNLETQLVEGLEKYLAEDLQLTTDEINEYLEQNGYASIEELTKDAFDSQELLDMLEESIFAVDGEYKFDGDKIYLDEEESLWIEYEFDGEDEADFEFDYDPDTEDVPDNADDLMDLLSGTYAKD